MKKKTLMKAVGMVLVLLLGFTGIVWADSASSLTGDNDVQ